MARQNITNSPADSGLGDTLKVAFDKVNAMTLELYTADASFASEIDAINSLINGGVDTLDHNHTIAQIQGLQAALNAKVSTSTFNTNILAINASIQAINDSLSDIIVILNSKVEEAPFSGITYGRNNGVWVEVTGGGPSGDFVPYTGATKNVNLGSNSLSMSGNVTARNFIINSTPYGELVIGDNNTYQSIYFNSIDTSNNYGTFNLVVNPEEGFVSTKTEISGNYTQINQSNNFILFKNYTSSGDILNTFSFDQTATVFSKVVNVNDGVQTGDVGGANYSQLGTNNGNYGIFYFKSTDSSNDDFGQCSLTINPEEGFVSQFTKTGGLISNISHNSVGLLVYVSDGTNFNNFNITNTETSSSKKVTTQEGFEGNYVQFNTAATETGAVGKLKWNDTDGTLDLGLKGGNVTLQVGQETVVRVVNKSGSLISNGSVVKVINNPGGSNTAIGLAQANSDANSATVLGITTEDIANNALGFVTVQGLVHDMNTNAYTEGDVLYLSPTVAGGITNVKPVAPQHMVIVGYVAKKGVADGHILMHVQNGYELDELHNVSISGATNGQVLTYDSANGLWENQTLPTIESQIGYTPYKFINVTSVAHTGTTSETIISTATISGGTFNSDDIMKVFMQTSKLLTSNNVTYRFKINTSNTLVGAVQVGTFTTSTTLSYVQIQRTFTLTNNLLYGYTFAGSAVNDFANTGGNLSSTACDTSNTFYIFFTVQLGNINDSATIRLSTVTN